MMKTSILAMVLGSASSTVSGSSIELGSGHSVSVDEFDPSPVTVPGTVFWSATALDNLIAATDGTKTFATQRKYAVPHGSTESVIAQPSVAGAIELKTYFSEKYNDTLNVASAQGLAFAADPANGYVFQRVEGYCLPSKPTTGNVVEYVQMWSDQRKDSFMVGVGSDHQKACVDYVQKWTECYVAVVVPPPCGKFPNFCGGTGNWTTWENKPQEGIPWPKSKDLLGWEFLSGANPGYGSASHTANSADTWYPTWAADGNLYTPWTDGSVIDDETGVRVSSGSGGHSKEGYNSTTGQAVIVGGDPFALNITKVKTFTSSTFPYQGRYPCGSLFYKGTWWYGTYYLDNPNVTIGPVYSGPNPGPNCGNWCVQGPVVDFRYSTDMGSTWKEPRVNATTGSDNLFGETAANNSKVKFGAPHWVDFGQEMEHSPDGKAYLVGHGATSPESVQAWMLGDEVYMARVTPTIENIGDKTKWEFYSGGTGDQAVWTTGDVSKAKPLVTWDNHAGVVTMTYFNAIKKYVLTISTASFYPSMVKQFDTYFLESDSITGPWSYVNYNSMFGPEVYFANHPSKFAAKKANTTAKVYDTFLMYSANFAFKQSSNPPNSAYHMNLQQARFPLSDGFAAKLAAMYETEQE